jgi:hypothetical protein
MRSNIGVPNSSSSCLITRLIEDGATLRTNAAWRIEPNRATSWK